MGKAAEGRIGVLDSLRGIAALAVAVGHCLVVFVIAGRPNIALADPRDLNWVTWPFRLFHTVFDGGSAVAIFFVLSGYVLTRALARSPSLPVYALRRFARLWPPLLVAVLLSWIVVDVLFFAVDSPIYADWMRQVFGAPLTATDAWRNLVLLDSHADNVTWTIIVEAWGSAALPLILWGFRRFSPNRVMIGLMLLSIACPIIPAVVYMVAFGAGAWIASRPALPRGHPLVYLGLGWVLLGIEAETRGGAGTIYIGFALGAAGVIIAVLKAQPRWMTARPLEALGRISYSFYLLHPVALYAVAALATRLGLSDLPGTFFVLVVSLALAVPMAALSYRFVELPSMGWMKRQVLQQQDRLGVGDAAVVDQR